MTIPGVKWRKRLPIGVKWRKEDSEQDTLTDVTFSEVCDILSNKRRRLSIIILDEEGQMKLGRLTDELMTYLDDMEGTKDRKAVYVGLYQTHVPKLKQAGLIEYDQTKTITPSEDLSILIEIMADIQKYVKSEE